MATLTSKLTLTGSSSEFGAALSLAVDDSLTVGEPFSAPSRKSIGIVTTQSFSADLTAAQAAHTFVYLKNMDLTNIITVSTVTGAQAFLTLNPGEFAYFPLKGGIGLTALANSADCILEYAYYSRS
jgi:hypothetical protein